MNTYLKSAGLAALGLAALATQSQAITVTIDPNPANWLAFANFSNLDGSPAFASGWGFADAAASFTGGILTLNATPIPTADGFWYVNGTGGPGAAGNKIADMSVYIEDASLVGQVVTFQGDVLANTFGPGRTVIAFIRDFAPDFSSFETTFISLTPGVFSITLDTIDAPGRHVQYGFNMVGPNVWPTDLGLAGSAVIAPVTAIPEPSSFALIGALASGAFAGMRRRRR